MTYVYLISLLISLVMPFVFRGMFGGTFLGARVLLRSIFYSTKNGVLSLVLLLLLVALFAGFSFELASVFDLGVGAIDGSISLRLFAAWITWGVYCFIAAGTLKSFVTASTYNVPSKDFVKLFAEFAPSDSPFRSVRARNDDQGRIVIQPNPIAHMEGLLVPTAKAVFAANNFDLLEATSDHLVLQKGAPLDLDD